MGQPGFRDSTKSGRDRPPELFVVLEGADGLEADGLEAERMGEAAVGGGGEVKFARCAEHLAQGGYEFLAFLEHVEIDVGHCHVVGVAFLQEFIHVAGHVGKPVFYRITSAAQFVDGFGVFEHSDNLSAYFGE